MRLANNVQTVVAIVSSAIVPTFVFAVTMPAFDLPQIGGVDIPKTAKAGETVRVTVKAAKDGTSTCGMVINFGDGVEQQFKINAEGGKLPVSVEHVYTKAGKYTIQAKGRKITTHHSCKDSASATIQINPVKKVGKASTPK
jgi:hypothetical protein